MIDESVLLSLPVPLPDSHHKRIDVLVQRVQQRDGLDDHVVHPVDVELDLGARVRVRQPQLRLVQVYILELRNEAGQVGADAAEELRDIFTWKGGKRRAASSENNASIHPSIHSSIDRLISASLSVILQRRQELVTSPARALRLHGLAGSTHPSIHPSIYIFIHAWSCPPWRPASVTCRARDRELVCDRSPELGLGDAQLVLCFFAGFRLGQVELEKVLQRVGDETW